jgi:hypothetical protein
VLLHTFLICTVHLGTIKLYYSPTNAQVIILKNNIKIYIKIAPLFSLLPNSATEAVLIQFNSPDDKHDVLQTCREL